MTFHVIPTVHGGVLDSGRRYRLELVVAAENAPARTFVAVVELPENWFEGGVPYGKFTAAGIRLSGLPARGMST